MKPAEMRATIVAKSDQINAEDLMPGPRKVTVAGVSAGNSAEQPVSIKLKNSERVYRPCKSMRRVLIYAWGDNGHDWVGRSMVLYYDPAVKYAGIAVGGIRISHLSHIAEPFELPLMVTRGKRSPYKVDVLKSESKSAALPPGGGQAGDGGAPRTTSQPAQTDEWEFVKTYREACECAQTEAQTKQLAEDHDKQLKALGEEAYASCLAAWETAMARFEKPEDRLIG